jgi:phage baseplate assembly protein W
MISISNPTRTYVDLDLAFNANPITGDVSKNVGNLAPINALRYLLQTNHYETPFDPDQATNITKLLFENVTVLAAAALRKEITNTIKNYEKRVTIESLEVIPDPNNNYYQVNLIVFITGSIDPISVPMFLKRIT